MILKGTIVGVGVTGLLIMTGFLTCTPVVSDTGTEEEAYLLQLSLEETGRTTAEFSGSPVQATILLDRDTTFNVLTWYTGQGYPVYPEDILNKRAKKFTIELNWNAYPLHKDTVDDCYYDTVWVSIGGGLKKSNRAFVKVTNLPIVVDSARFDTISYLGQDTVWQCSLPPTLKASYQLTIFARDLDRKPPMLQYLGNRGTIVPDGNNPLEMEYFPPEGDFRDSIDFIIFDQKRGQAFRRLLVSHISPNVPPSIDSFLVKNTILNSSSLVNGVYRVAFIAFDTLQLNVYAHDTLGSLQRAVWKAVENSITADSSSSFRATYVCEDKTCTDTLRDSSVVIDIITVTVFDDRGDSAVRKVELSKGKLNQPPQIESFLFGGEAVRFTDSRGTVSATGGETYPITIETADPEKKDVTVSWSGTPSARFSLKTDSSILYKAPLSLGTDTLMLSVSDGTLTAVRSLLIEVSDIGPQFDSVSVGRTIHKGTDTVFTAEVTAGDTLTCIAYGTDRDTGDTIIYTWSSSHDERFLVRILNRARYILPDPLIKDTIILTLQDGEAQSVRKIVVAPANRPPVIDSIHGDGKRLSGTLAFLNDTAVAADTVTFAGFAHDPESGSLTWTWSATDTLLFITRNSSSVKYRCADSVYTDTVSVSVKDEDGGSAVRKIILSVDTLKGP